MYCGQVMYLSDYFFKHSMAFCLSVGQFWCTSVLSSSIPFCQICWGNYLPFRNVCNLFLPVSFWCKVTITTKKKRKDWVWKNFSCLGGFVPWENGKAKTVTMITYSWLVWIQMAFFMLVVYLNTNNLVVSASYRFRDILNKGERIET